MIPISTASARVPPRVLLIAPLSPPYGGMALQAEQLQTLMRMDGAQAELLGYNQAFSHLKVLERIYGVRTALRTIVFCIRFWRRARAADVVHVLAASWLYFFVVAAPAIVMARWQRKRTILNYRAGSADEFLRAWGWLAKPFFRLSDFTTAPSRFLADVIQRRIGVPVTIVPNIVNFSIFRYRERSQLRPRMLVTRHLLKLYGVDVVLRAFREIQANHPEASLFIAGAGAEEANLRKMVADWSLQNVQFLGYIDHKSLPGIYDQCDILLNGSNVDNFPGSLMEASAAGLAVVSTNAGGIPFIYKDGENALLVNVGDWHGLAAAVERILSDSGLAQQVIAAGREVCRQCEWTSLRVSLYSTYGFALPDTGFEGSALEPQLAFSQGGKGGL